MGTLPQNKADVMPGEACGELGQPGTANGTTLRAAQAALSPCTPQAHLEATKGWPVTSDPPEKSLGPLASTPPHSCCRLSAPMIHEV